VARNGKSQDRVGAAPRLRRAYYECRYGQLHLHNAIPAGGGFDELTPVICIHAPGETGRAFMPVLPALGAARSVYALDLPGAGESDPAPGETALDAAVHAVGDFVDSMRIRTFDLIVRGSAAPVAQRLLEARGEAVRRVVVLGADGQRGGARIALLSGAEAAGPQLPSRLIELLRAGP
jgi:pimeloyl-ACP methyl ester carboxylesterase